MITTVCSAFHVFDATHPMQTWWDAYQLDGGKQILWVPYEEMKKDPARWVSVCMF